MASKIAASTRRIPLRMGRAILDSTITEAEFQRRIITLATLTGWLCYHTHDSRRSQPGFPDLVLCKNKLIFVELKTERGKLRPEQVQWLDALRASGVEAVVWRPRDWQEIEQTLRERS